jgi:hypothetical protein
MTNYYNVKKRLWLCLWYTVKLPKYIATLIRKHFRTFFWSVIDYKFSSTFLPHRKKFLSNHTTVSDLPIYMKADLLDSHKNLKSLKLWNMQQWQNAHNILFLQTFKCDWFIWHVLNKVFFKIFPVFGNKMTVLNILRQIQNYLSFFLFQHLIFDGCSVG